MNGRKSYGVCRSETKFEFEKYVVEEKILTNTFPNSAAPGQ